MRRIVSVVLVLLALSVLVLSEPRATWAAAREAAREAAPEQAIVVRLRPGHSLAEARPALAAAGARPIAAPGLARLGAAVLLAPAETAPRVAAELGRQPGVLAAEVARPVHAADTIPNDPGWPQQYGPAHIQAPTAWDVTQGSAAVVLAVVDSGMDFSHPDLAGRAWMNPGETPGNGIDDDRNGYVDDVNGWDFVNSDALPQDDQGHGTHVAGIAAAAGNNGLGVAGMAWGTRLMVLKVLDGGGRGYDYTVAEAIVYAADNGARVINVSLGGVALGAVVEQAVNYAYTRGAVIVAAAGNTGAAGEGLLYPAAYDNVIAVMATDEDDARAAYSSYGDKGAAKPTELERQEARHTEMAAPGSGIYSTLLGGSYGRNWGTSMAAPHVAGAAALLASLPEFDTPREVREALCANALDLGDAGWDEYYGCGLIQVSAAMGRTPAPAPPPAPETTCRAAAAACLWLFMPVLQQ